VAVLPKPGRRTDDHAKEMLQAQAALKGFPEAQEEEGDCYGRP
jgi:hypothetical protein